MAHGITEKDTFVGYRVPAWHKLGEVFHKRVKSVEQLLKLTKLGWEVELQEFVTIPTLAQIESVRSGKKLTAGQLRAIVGEHAVPNLRAIVRKDTGDTLGVVTETYQPRQNVELFQFADALLGELLLETGFSLYEGRQVGILLEFPKHIVVGGDEVRRFLYLRTKHDGTGSTWAFKTNVRVVCANTDHMALTEVGGPNSPQILKLRHVGQDLSSQIAEARRALDLSVEYDKQFKQLGDRLAKQKMAERKLRDVMAQLWPTEDGSTDRTVKSIERKKGVVMDLFLHGKTVGNSPGTKWCAYNALVEFDQHDTTMRGADERRKAERRFIRAVEDPDGFATKALQLVAAA